MFNSCINYSIPVMCCTNGSVSVCSVPLVMVQTLITELLKITLGCDFNTVEDRLSGDTVTEEALFALHLYHRWYLYLYFILKNGLLKIGTDVLMLM